MSYIKHERKVKAADLSIFLNDLLSFLPKFCNDYFNAIETTTLISTRIAYAYD